MTSTDEQEGDQSFATMEIALTSVHRSMFGSFVLIGRDDRGGLRRALVPLGVAPRDPSAGETWRLTGTPTTHPQYGPQLQARVALPLLPKGQAIVRFLATERRFPGIGRASAERLWATFGEGLYEVLGNRDLNALSSVVGPDRAVGIVEGFGLLADEVDVFRWFDRYGIAPRVAATAASLWGREAIGRIEADPYALSLLEPWSEVDARALRLGLDLADPRRLCALVEEALAIRYRNGDMAAPSSVVLALIRRLAPRHVDTRRALDRAVAAGRVIHTADGLVQNLACHFMEGEVERLLRERLEDGGGWRTAECIRRTLNANEAGAGSGLTERQREAVRMALSSRVALIAGSAGTGKTTVLKAVVAAFEEHRRLLPPATQSEFECVQVALAGRAARRMSEATGREALTIARFLHQLEEAGRSFQRGLLIVDEASMLDTPSLYRVLSQISGDVDLLFVGDDGQLPPIGPGRPFGAMLEGDLVPRVSLDAVMRHAAETGIPTAAAAVREGRSPTLRRFDPALALSRGVFIAQASADEVTALTLEVFRSMSGPPPPSGDMRRIHSLDIQILTQTRNGASGSNALSRAIELEMTCHQARIADWGVCVGSRILWLENDYRKAPLKDEAGRVQVDPSTGQPQYAGFMNGAIGTVERALPNGAWVTFDDGTGDAILATDLGKLTYGWAITVHKAQGSGFKRVIIPISRSRLLDRTLLYTAITRAIDTVVLVGDPEDIEAAIRAAPRVHQRGIGLRLTLDLTESAGDVPILRSGGSHGARPARPQ